MELSRLPLTGWVTLERVATALASAVLAVCMINGLLDWAGLSPSYSRVLIEFLAAVLLLVSFLGARTPDRRGALVLSAPLLAATVIGVVVATLNGAKSVEQVLFAREILTPVLFLSAFLCAPVSDALRRRLLGLLAILVALQVFVCALKFALFGVNEKAWIGTMTQSAGQLGLLMPAMALGFAWAFGLVRARIALAATFALMIAAVGVVSEKRATMFLAPAIPMLTLTIWLLVGRFARIRRERPSRMALHYLVAVTTVSAIVGLGSLVVIPSLNAENPKYVLYGTHSVIDYIRVYLTRDYDSPMNISKTSIDDNQNIQLGRLLLLKRAVDLSLDQPLPVALTGHGGGWLLEHRFLPHKGGDVLYDRVGLRGPSGLLVRHLFEIGWIGVVLVLAWMFALVTLLLKALLKAPESVLAFGALTSVAVLLFDYTFYSEMTWNSGVFMPIFALLAAFALRSGPECRLERGC
ncbi:MAG: hypothetical protein KDE68_02535 [Rhodocyclaceae bacterium]|nr:hypothetical protein [Rhodocyclaceae bacterium]